MNGMALFMNRRGWVIILLLAVVILFTGLGRLPFIDRDEGEYSTVAQEMLDRSDYVIPHVNGRAYFEKPALFFWTMALSFQALGRTESAGRLPSAFSGLVVVLMLSWFGRRHGGPGLGMLAGLFGLTSIMLVMMSRVALVDMLLTVWTTAALMLFYEGYLASKPRDRWWFQGGWAALGLSFLTKGPVGVLVPVLALLPLAVMDRTLGATLKRVRIPTGLLIFLVISGPWYLLAFQRAGMDFYNGFFVGQNINRFTEVLLGHGPPIWYYIPVLCLGVWPWAFFAIPTLWRGLIKTSRAKRAADPTARFDLFLCLWLLAGLILFSLSATKLPHYILPVVPAALLLAARWWQEFLDGTRFGRFEKGTVFIMTALIGMVLALLLILINGFLPEILVAVRAGINPDSAEYAFPPNAPDLGLGTPIVGVLTGALVLLSLFFAKKARTQNALVSMALAGGIFIIGLTHITAPIVFDYLQTPARNLAVGVRATIGPDERLAGFGLYKPTLWFYTGNHIQRIRSDRLEELERFLEGRERGLILSRRSLLPILEDHPQFRLLRTEGGYILGDNRGAGQ